MESQSDGVTAALAKRAGGLTFADIPSASVEVAKQCLLDWLGVAIAARREPLVEMLIADAEQEGGKPQASIIAKKTQVSMRQAALINGAMGHALDYDDVTTTMGHPTVPVAPVVFALGEVMEVSGADLLAAFVAGIETEVSISLFSGPSHYARGFHGTATYGCFGAAAAAANMMRLREPLIRHALGIAGTQAAGLKAVFGTMSKPLHAGKAAVNGLFAAQLAARGFTSSVSILEAPRGFGATQSDHVDEIAALTTPADRFHIRGVLFKYHAACYLTHSTIAACASLRDQYAISPLSVRRIRLGVDPGHFGTCAIADPKTGLESKFSLAHTAALALSGENTASELTYSDAMARRPDLVLLREKVTLHSRTTDAFTRSDVEIELVNGDIVERSMDVAIPADDLEDQWKLLTGKFRTLVIPQLGEDVSQAVVEVCRTLEQETDLARLLRLIG